LWSHEGLVSKGFNFHRATSGVSVNKCTSGICFLADIANMFVKVKFGVDGDAEVLG